MRIREREAIGREEKPEPLPWLPALPRCGGFRTLMCATAALAVWATWVTVAE
jgi:hypothetical protein